MGVAVSPMGSPGNVAASAWLLTTRWFGKPLPPAEGTIPPGALNPAALFVARGVVASADSREVLPAGPCVPRLLVTAPAVPPRPSRFPASVLLTPTPFP